jgi:hypothetical protein
MTVLTLVLLCMAGGLGLVAFTMLGTALFKVPPRTTVIVQGPGKSVRKAGVGLRGRVSFFDKVVGRVKLRGHQVDVEMETRTGEHVYVRIVVAVRSVPGKTGKDVMNLVLMTQYLDLRKDAGASSRTNAFLFPYSPGDPAALGEQMRNAMIEAGRTVALPELMCRPVPKLIGRPLHESRSAPPDSGRLETRADGHVPEGTGKVRK